MGDCAPGGRASWVSVALGQDGGTHYAVAMNESRASSMGRHALALVVLLVAAWLLLHFIIHVAVVVASIVVVVVAVVAVVWALRVLL